MGKVNASIYKLALFLGVILAYVVVNDVHWDMNANIHTPQVSAGVEVQIDSTPGNNIFNPTAPIDSTDQITVTPPTDYPVLLPTDTDVETPTVLQDGIYIPEESPNGGHFSEWFDNSPHYSDGYTLVVNDSATPITVSWHFTGLTDIDLGA